MAKTPKIPRQRVGKLMRTLFRILLANPDGIQAQDAMTDLDFFEQNGAYFWTL